MTSTLSNERVTDPEGLTVHSRIYAGNGTDGEAVGEGKEPVGGLDGESKRDRDKYILLNSY